MSDRLPPLTALRAFEAAARHLSFQAAASELNVTPAALSFQIKSLEEHLGAPLFRRLNRRVELTDAGSALAPQASEGFQTLTTGWRTAKRVLDNGILTITAGPAFTAKWLAPRLFDFAGSHPEIELRFAATLRMLDFAIDDIDIAIRFGSSDQPDDPTLHRALTIAEWVTPMMHPDLAARYPTPASLLDATIIFDDSITFLKNSVSWADWFAAHDIASPDLHGPHFPPHARFWTGLSGKPGAWRAIGPGGAWSQPPENRRRQPQSGKTKGPLPDNPARAFAKKSREVSGSL